MVTLSIIPNDNTDVDEFVKSICFVSSDIIGITKKTPKSRWKLRKIVILRN